MGMGKHLAHVHPSCGKRGLLGTKGVSTVHFIEAPSMKVLLLLVFMSTLLDCSDTVQNCTKPCHKHAKCEIRNGNPGCYCTLGFTGPGINATGGSGCYDDNECANATQLCGENANCTNTVGGYFCTCAPGFRSSNGNETFVTNDGTSCIEIPTAKCELKHDCIAERINRTLDKIRKIKEPLAVLQEINQNTVGQISPVEVISYVEALFVSGPLFTTMNISATETNPNLTLNELVNTVNNFVQKDKNAAWEAIPGEDRRKTLTKLMHAAEQTAALVSQNFKKPTEVEVNASDLVLKVFSFNMLHVDHILQHVHMGGDTIEVATKKEATATSEGTVAVVFLQYSNIGSLLSSSQNFSLKENPEHGETVGSSVIAVAVSATLPLLYPVEKITFTLKHAQIVGKKNIKCAFWNYSEDTMEGNWSTEGCTQTHFNSTHTSCTCDHLTHFAVLMSSNNSEVDVKDYILTRITQLGIIISLICLSMCIFTFWFFSEIQSTRTTIHKNLCCSLFLAELVFLVGINMSSNKLFCSITAGLLHYFLLAAFAWMCIEGIHLYLIVVGVIYNKGFLHKNFYVFGYVSPAVVVGISAILGYKYYGRPEVCWLSTKNNFIWSFIGPACLIILVNLMAFGVIIYKVFQQTALLKPEVSNYENIRSCARGALSLLFLLGATWIFGVLHVIQGSVVTAYLFTVFNAFQGLFIFIFLCVLSRKIQDEYSRLFRNVPCCFGCLR